MQLRGQLGDKVRQPGLDVGITGTRVALEVDVDAVHVPGRDRRQRVGYRGLGDGRRGYDLVDRRLVDLLDDQYHAGTRLVGPVDHVIQRLAVPTGPSGVAIIEGAIGVEGEPEIRDRAEE